MMDKTEMMGVTFNGTVTFNGPMFDIHDNEHVTIVNDRQRREAPLTTSEKDIKKAIEKLMEERDEQGNYLMREKEQWWAVKMVLTSVCGFPMKPSDFGRAVKNLELDVLRVCYEYESVRKVHAHQLPKNVALWHNYQNTADEYSRKQVVVATRLMELLEE